MKLAHYIRDEVFLARLGEKQCLVVYDPERRFREIIQGLEGPRRRVIDASRSLILQREAATAALLDLGAGKIDQMLVWYPSRPPAEEERWQQDPFAAFARIGTHFPQGDGDDFPSLCRRAKPDHVTEVNRLFEAGVPTFAMLDALDEGGSWPRLKTVLDAKSPREILIGLLTPSDSHQKSLQADGNWFGEAREFIHRTLGHRLRATDPGALPEELWRLILFSEFVFDIEEPLPPALEPVPRACPSSREVVFTVCHDLRRNQDHQHAYLSRALDVEVALRLPALAKAVTCLGQRDTFSFEERLYLGRFIGLAIQGNLAEAREIWDSRRKSIWLNHEDRLGEWSVACRALDVLETAARLPAPDYRDLTGIIRAYSRDWRELDRHHREMEQAIHQCEHGDEDLQRLVEHARETYFARIESLHAKFLERVAQENWPPNGDGLRWNCRVFKDLVDPILDAGEKVAYFLIDSLRYELGVELEKQIAGEMPVTLHTVCAQLPTYTEVGMASLMPDADRELVLAEKNGKPVTTLGGKVATAPAARLSYMRSKKGDRCEDIALEELIRKRKFSLPETTRLLVVRSREIDAIAHTSPRDVLQVIPSLVRQIIRGLFKVADLGFTRAVVATDHGFLLFHEQRAGNVASAPPGNWPIKKSRCLLGHGEENSGSVVLKTADLGIRTENCPDYATPRALVPYHEGRLYYHEGLSLQECVLPALVVTLPSGARRPDGVSGTVNLMLAYRHGKTDQVPTRRPIVDLSWPSPELFGDQEIEVSIEVVDAEGTVVGDTASGQSFNPATGGVRIQPGESLAVGLRMKDDFSGGFSVRVLDASNGTLFAEINLRTAYLE